MPQAALIKGVTGCSTGRRVSEGRAVSDGLFARRLGHSRHADDAPFVLRWRHGRGLSGRESLRERRFLYGTTAEGGAPGFGTVFRLSTSGSMDWVTPFVNALDGQSPRGGVVEMGATLRHGRFGRVLGSGTVFKVTSAGALDEGLRLRKRPAPVRRLTLARTGSCTGRRARGGELPRTVFRLDPSVTPVVDQTLHSFNGTNGSYPTTGLVKGSDGRLFGTTSEDGPGGYGTAYWVQPIFPTSGVFYADPGTEGAGPFSPL